MEQCNYEVSKYMFSNENQSQLALFMRNQFSNFLVASFLNFIYFYQYNFCMHNLSTTGIGPVLSIRSDQDKGLVLNWNFTGIYSPTFQHYHIFVFVAQDVQQSRTFLESYHANLKIGEIMGLYCTRTDYSQVRKKIIWNQKSGYGSSEIDLKKTSLIQELHGSLIQQICQKQIKKRGIIIFNIFCDFQTSSKDKLSKLCLVLNNTVNKLRQKNKEYDKIIFNLISNNFQYSRLNTNNGLNLMRYDKENSLLSCEDIIVYIRTIAVKNLTILLETKGKFNMVLFSSNQWNITDSMQIEKKYYGLPKVKFSQNIKILELRKGSSPNFQLDITLNFTFFDGKEIHDKKTFSFEGSHDKLLLKSVNATTDLNKYTNYEIAKGYFIQSNLLRQESLILLTRVQEQAAKNKRI